MYPIKRMLDVFLIFKEFKARVELEIDKIINCLGYDGNVKGCCLWGSYAHKVIVSSDVILLQPKSFKGKENLVCRLNTFLNNLK